MCAHTHVHTPHTSRCTHTQTHAHTALRVAGLPPGFHLNPALLAPLASQDLTLPPHLPCLDSIIQLRNLPTDADELWVLHLVLFILRLSSLPWAGLLFFLVLAQIGQLDSVFGAPALAKLSVSLWGSNPSGHQLPDTGLYQPQSWPYRPNCFRSYNHGLQLPLYPSLCLTDITLSSCAPGPLTHRVPDPWTTLSWSTRPLPLPLLHWAPCPVVLSLLSPCLQMLLCPSLTCLALVPCSPLGPSLFYFRVPAQHPNHGLHTTARATTRISGTLPANIHAQTFLGTPRVPTTPYSVSIGSLQLPLVPVLPRFTSQAAQANRSSFLSRGQGQTDFSGPLLLLITHSWGWSGTCSPSTPAAKSQAQICQIARQLLWFICFPHNLLCGCCLSACFMMFQPLLVLLLWTLWPSRLFPTFKLFPPRSIWFMASSTFWESPHLST